jgi:hypothetical protein
MKEAHHFSGGLSIKKAQPSPQGRYRTLLGESALGF